MQFFFPFIASDHTYVIYINAKAGIDIIDNSFVDVANDMKYGTIPVDLLLRCKATTLKNVVSVILQME